MRQKLNTWGHHFTSYGLSCTSPCVCADGSWVLWDRRDVVLLLALC
jgi:hypothetical protein